MWNDSVEWIHQPPEIPTSNNLAVKRQRRPSVRLGEIGDPPAFLKRKKQAAAPLPFLPIHGRQAEDAVNSDGNGAIDPSAAQGAKAGKITKTRPLVHVTGGNLHEQNSSSNGGDGLGYLASVDRVSPQSVIPAENQSGLLLASQGGTSARKLQPGMKIADKKGWDGKRRRGGPKGLAPFDRLTKAVASVIEIGDNGHEKASGMDDSTDPHSDGAYDAGTPEGHRDSYPDASDFSKDMKEFSNSQEIGTPEADTSVRAPLDYLQGHRFSQVAKEHALTGELERNQRNEKKGGFANNADGKSLTETRARPLHEAKTKLTLEANGNSGNRERNSENGEEQCTRAQAGGRHYSSFETGVRGWLQSLGLSKYAQLFETHEVDAEVLPLLTLDDLKEMGVTAVGTRRKLFCAIQQLGKA